MGKYQVTAQQQAFLGTWLAFLVSPFPTPTADQVVVPRDTRDAPTGTTVQVPAAMAGVRLDTGGVASTGPPGWSLAGIPMQAVDTFTPTRSWTVGTSVYGYTTWSVRTPADLWVEGMPRTRMWPLGPAPGDWDRHVVFVGATSVVEMIGVDADRSTAEKAVEWSWGGQVVRQFPAGRPTGVARSEVPMHRYIMTRRSLVEPHVLGVTMPDAAAGPDSDGSLPPSTPFPRYNQWLRLTQVPVGLSGDALTVARILATKGARVVDITGQPVARIWTQPGAQWAGSNIHTLSLPLALFEAA